MKKRFLITLVLFFISTSSALAWTSYQKDLSPFDLRGKANMYTQNNPYSKHNNNNPYSTFQGVYNPNSVHNNFDTYSAQVSTYSGQFQGNISQQIHDPKALTNPYGKYGKNFQGIHPSRPYVPQKWNNPYSTFQKPYIPQSVHNNEQYAVKYNDGYGNKIGVAQTPTYYNFNSITNPYNNSPFNPQHVVNPYGNNKRFK